MEQSNEHKSHECTLTDQELIVACADWIQQLIDTGGKAFRMNVPARTNKDPDLLLSELVERFKDKLSQPQSEGVLQWVKGEYHELYRQVKSGIETPCLVDYHPRKGETVYRDICSIRYPKLELRCRGTGYGEANDFRFWDKDLTEEQAFVKLCEHRNVEWICFASPSTTNEKEPRRRDFLKHLGFHREASPATTAANTEEGAEPGTREQYIAFAEWMGRKNVALYESGQYYYSLKGTWIFLANNFDELYELFLTEYTKQ